jgi:hypothetical protein
MQRAIVTGAEEGGGRHGLETTRRSVLPIGDVREALAGTPKSTGPGSAGRRRVRRRASRPSL